MLRSLLKSKIHHARVTEADLHYVGSVTIDKDLMVAADLLPNERVLVANIENGERFETYCFEGAAGSGVLCMNGACARLVDVGDQVIIMAFALVEDEKARTFHPKVIFVDEQNRITGRHV